jgi:Trk K+ transport system NAD-binding subunit
VLKVKTLSHIGAKAEETDARVVIVEDLYENPIAVVCELATGMTTVVSASDDDFNRVLKSLGIDKLVINNKATAPEVPEGAKLLYDPRKV